MTTSTRPKRFRLSFVGPIEDQPRLIRAYGRACAGEFALVMRPGEGRAVLVLITKQDGAFLWQSGDDAGDNGLVRSRATVLRDGRTTLRIETGAHSGASFQPYSELPARVVHGQEVDVVFAPEDQFAHVRGAGVGGDSPGAPESPITAADAVKRIKAEQKAVPKEGPTTLRGRWTGYLYCEDGNPRVELTRRLATYGTLTLSSHLDDGWSWSFERSEKWFSEEGDTAGEGFGTLSAAIEAGVLGAMSLVREACSFRDTRRRAAHDSVYAERHPIKPPRPMKNPTERLKVRDRGRKQKTAAPPKAIEDGTALPDAPEGAASLAIMARSAAREGNTLGSLSGHRWIWEESTPARDIADWFADNGFEAIADSIRGYSRQVEIPLEDFLEELGRDLGMARVLHDAEPDPQVYERAEMQLVALRRSLRTAPAMMERARRLIRYAGAMVKSPLCTGRERKEAVAALRGAVSAYEEARAAILEGQPWDALKTLRRIGERVALSAAKAGRSCAAGQTSLTALVEREDDRAKSRAAAGSSRVVPEGWEPFEVGDRAVFEELHGTVSRVPPRAYGPADKVTFLADGRRRGRRVEARLLVREEAVVEAEVAQDEAPADAEKDKALIDAFSAAIAAAMGEEAA